MGPNDAFEVKSKDLAGRIGILHTPHGKIETPYMFPVINPNKMVVDLGKIEKMGFNAIITNAYILFKKGIEQDVHKFLHFNGPIMTDSGAFQLMVYGGIDISNKEIISYQKKINVDIGVILDTPCPSTKRVDVERAVNETIESAREAKSIIDDKRLWCGPIQGTIYKDLLKKCAKEVGSFHIHPIGSVVPLLQKYEFDRIMEIIKNVKEILPPSKPIHLFGAGHPIIFAFAVAMGIDLFDSASYALFAKEGKYMTVHGTYNIKELNYLPCSCPVCSQKDPGEFNESDLAEHNLYVCIEEIKRIKQHIKEGTLFELLEERARAHPALVKAFERVVKFNKYLDKWDRITKKHIFILSELSKKRPEILRALKMKRRVKDRKKINIQPYGLVPKSIVGAFPFSQTVPGGKVIEEEPELVVRDLSKYWFGIDIFPQNIKIETAKTGRIRAVYEDGEILATLRASDYMIILKGGSKYLWEKTKYPERRIIIEKLEGKSIFCKFVKDVDPNLHAGEQVLIVDEKDNLLGSGELLLCGWEIPFFKRGVAAKVRWINQAFSPK